MIFESSGLLFRKVPLPDHVPGSLYLHPMPGSYEEITTFVTEVERRKISRIICLPCPDEITEVSPEYLTLIREGTCPCAIVCFPIPDFGIPDDPEELLILTQKCADFLQKGDSMLVHCRMGIGRTGIFAIMVLMASGIPIREAELIVRKAGAGPQTRAQKDLLLWAESRLLK